MSNEKHTPGPWHVNYTTFDNAIVRFHIAGETHGSVYPVCEHTLEITPDSSEQLANAHLIAAAPELLEALKRAAAMMGRFPQCDEAWKQARAAIAKAEGK